MNFKILFPLVACLGIVCGCATSSIPVVNQSEAFEEAETFEEDLFPDTQNGFGWDESNCAHIMADGNCAHPL